MGETLISIKEAKPEKLFYVVANIIIINKADASCLILKRSNRGRSVFTLRTRFDYTRRYYNRGWTSSWPKLPWNYWTSIYRSG